MENQKKEYKPKINKLSKRKVRIYNRALNRLMTLMFITFIVIVILLNILKTDKTFSEEENRTLATMPKFTIKKLPKWRFH